MSGHNKYWPSSKLAGYDIAKAILITLPRKQMHFINCVRLATELNYDRNRAKRLEEIEAERQLRTGDVP